MLFEQGLATAFHVNAESFRIAIFDYDLRAENEKTVAKYTKDKLLKSGLDFKQIDLFSGEDSLKKSLAVLNQIEADQYDLVITITSDAMIPGHHKLKKTPWLFTNVNNPTFFGIQDPDNPGRNRSGVTYYVSVKEQLALFKEIMGGDLTTIGLIFDATAKSRKAELGEFRAAALALGITAEIALINKAEELPAAVGKLLNKKVNAVVATSSGKIYSNLDLISDICTENRIPIFSVNKKGVAEGAVCAFASDYYSMVDECLIPMAIQVLNGQDPGKMAVQTLKTPALYLNVTQAKRLGITIPGNLKKKASKKF